MLVRRKLNGGPSQSRIMNTLLIGPRACGKSTIGRLLAQRVGLPLLDLDELVLKRFAQRSIAAVWSAQGENAWRQAELMSLQEALKSGESIIALGGGTPIIPAARDMIESARNVGAARVIYLCCSPDVLLQRLARNPGDRPSLTGADVAEEASGVLAGRHAKYQALADWECDTGKSAPSAVVNQLVKRFFNRPDSAMQPDR